MNLARSVLSGTSVALLAKVIATGGCSDDDDDSTPVGGSGGQSGGAFDAALKLPEDGKRRVVILQHGIWRTSASLWRLERTLRAHGYEVHNPGYPSTAASIEDHAERLRRFVEQVCERPVDELSFVGHSMGGLVIEEYLRRPDARPVAACVYVATPHRGALLADLRKHWFVYRWAMGTTAAMQLSPDDALHRRPLPRPEIAGSLAGDVGEGHPSLPGHDDGTVTVAEATFPGAREALVVPVAHTWIGQDPDTILAVLRFLRRGSFARGPAPR
jgi:pimeloyl-ACP methyl ester carboxylesterase